MPPWRIYLEVWGNPGKNDARPIVLRDNFREGFGHYTDQNTPYKGWKRMKALACLEHSIQMDWKIWGLKATNYCSRTEYSIFLKEKSYRNTGYYTRSDWLRGLFAWEYVNTVVRSQNFWEFSQPPRVGSYQAVQTQKKSAIYTGRSNSAYAGLNGGLCY